METRGGTWATRVKATEHSMIVVNDRPLSLTRYSFSLFYTYILYVHAPGVNSGSKDTTGLVWPEVIPALYQYVLQASQGLEVIPTLYQFYTTFKSQMYPRDFIHIPIKNQSWNHVSISLETMLVSVLAGYQGGPSYLSRFQFSCATETRSHLLAQMDSASEEREPQIKFN
jgi:hypothetical protein